MSHETFSEFRTPFDNDPVLRESYLRLIGKIKSKKKPRPHDSTPKAVSAAEIEGWFRLDPIESKDSPPEE